MSAAANGTDVCAREAGRTRANAAAHAVQPTTAHAFNNGLHPGVCTAPYKGGPALEAERFQDDRGHGDGDGRREATKGDRKSRE